MLSLFQCVYLVVVLAIGLSVIYLLRYYKKTGKLLGLIKFLVIVAIAVIPAQAQDIDLDDTPAEIEDLKPIVGDPMRLVQSANTLMAGVNGIAEEAAIASKVRAFLGDGDALNITLANNSTGLFYA